ncbi:hypothetical protein TNCV_534401 [Trichonephila clavipes]|nr:hypothetical protein TNCV_534401 [Trichonephila clavipes]
MRSAVMALSGVFYGVNPIILKSDLMNVLCKCRFLVFISVAFLNDGRCQSNNQDRITDTRLPKSGIPDRVLIWDEARNKSRCVTRSLLRGNHSNRRLCFSRYEGKKIGWENNNVGNKGTAIKLKSAVVVDPFHEFPMWAGPDNVFNCSSDENSAIFGDES